MRNRMFLIVFVFAFFLSSCKQPDGTIASQAPAESFCRGVYTTRDSSGDLKKYNEYAVDTYGKRSCMTQAMQLTNFEKSSEAWRKQNTTCKPVTTFPSTSLLAANNFYSYRDGKLWIDLNATNGIYRKLTLAEAKDQGVAYKKGVLTFVKEGDQAFTYEQGCWFARTATGIDAGYGTQILLDNSVIAASESFVPFEIYKLESQDAGSMFLRRYDYITDWQWSFCPESSTPWGFCDALRNGDIMFYPTLTAAQMTKLYEDAIKIRTEFNFQKTSRAQFDQAWLQAYEARLEATRNDWLYEVGFLVDTPPWIDQAWREYVKGTRPRMPTYGSQ